MSNKEIGELLRKTSQYAIDPEFIEKMKQDLLVRLKAIQRSKMYNHTLHFHSPSLAEQARKAIWALNLELQDLCIGDTPRSVNFETQDELDTATIALILEHTKPLDSHFNEDDEEQRAIRACEAWARIFFASDNAEVVGVRHVGDTWIMELQRTGRTTNPTVTFTIKDSDDFADPEV